MYFLFLPYCFLKNATLIVLQLKDLRVDQWIELCVGLTQENLIGFQVQTNLLQTIVCVHTILSYSKVYVFAILHNIICSRSF